MDAADMLHRIRTILEITRAELARLAQLSPSTVGRIEKRTLDPTWGTLTRILEETGFRIQGTTSFHCATGRLPLLRASSWTRSFTPTTRISRR
ncbi:helix-turn-helix domain-containing protein [Brachybacterium sp. Z12]|uniref:helix-turn-helix domain-containing protein n=1 Tax=Brachybacterium sp. Z12 TaxID=2759167 RepID=UPI00185FA4FB|nr:helix-turn-helix domain-containing protein [Brachybacterium sp. Z12]QNN82240.1 helix-turn-helix domain-containing protein [Brachybacterium sp. Z12]